MVGAEKGGSITNGVGGIWRHQRVLSRCIRRASRIVHRGHAVFLLGMALGAQSPRARGCLVIPSISMTCFATRVAESRRATATVATGRRAMTMWLLSLLCWMSCKLSCALISHGSLRGVARMVGSLCTNSHRACKVDLPPLRLLAEANRIWAGRLTCRRAATQYRCCCSQVAATMSYLTHLQPNSKSGVGIVGFMLPALMSRLPTRLTTVAITPAPGCTRRIILRSPWIAQRWATIVLVGLASQAAYSKVGTA
mmetsp:Transcript_81546/g.212078  ORF Transcript_81546/g.212078 Transcript_81546/m.212078 type:complete len:253 (+) Transcript_81546:335-1093(+)